MKKPDQKGAMVVRLFWILPLSIPTVRVSKGRTVVRSCVVGILQVGGSIWTPPVGDLA